MKFSLWQTLCGVLSSALLTGASAWLAFGKDTVTRPELASYVQERSPWVQDRGAIQVTLSATRETLSDLRKQMSELIAAQHALALKIERLAEKR